MSNDKTAAAIPDDLLRGRPKLTPCARCGASRADQVRTSFYTQDGDPLCVSCWQEEYGEEGRDPWI